MIEIGCSTICFRRLDFASAMGRISDLGFVTADIGMLKGFCDHFDPLSAGENEKDRFVEYLRATGVKVSALNVGHGKFNVGAKRDMQVRFVQACIGLASDLDCYTVTVQPGAPAKGSWRDDALQVAGDLRRLAEEAAAFGVTVTVEMPHAGSLVTSIDQALELLRFSRSANLLIALDTSHVMWSGLQPSEAVRLLGETIGHVHIRDASGQSILLTPGDGEVDFSSFHESLRDIGYRRSAIVELEWEDKTTEETAEEVLRSRRYLEDLWGRQR